MTIRGTEVTDIREIERIFSEAKVCRLALMNGEYPYVIPMCFGYDMHGDMPELYFHCAAQGRKLELVKKDNHAAFEIDCMKEIIPGEIPCTFTASYESVTGSGTVEIINGIEKLTGLNCIVRKYDDSQKESKYSEQALNSVVILKLTVTELCCKIHKPD
jgi:hypothetical protein